MKIKHPSSQTRYLSIRTAYILDIDETVRAIPLRHNFNLRSVLGNVRSLVARLELKIPLCDAKLEHLRALADGD